MRYMKTLAGLCLATTLCVFISFRWKQLPSKYNTIVIHEKEGFILQLESSGERLQNQTFKIHSSSSISPKTTSFETTNISVQEGPCPVGAYQYVDKYCVIPYWRKRKRVFSETPDVTLCTQSTPEFLYHLNRQCVRWLGPMSISVYVSSSNNFAVTTKLIDTMINCDSCIKENVDWHLLYEPERAIETDIDSSEGYDCKYLKNFKKYLIQRNGTYPINAVRNVARNHTNTSHVLLIDIELYPNLDLRNRFNLMMKDMGNIKKRTVYVLPVFEVWKKFHTPKTKAELQNMFHKTQAISFHHYQCPICHEIPDLGAWINFTVPENSSKTGMQPLHIWRTVKRNKEYKLNAWEPFFIGTKSDPSFDVRLTWEGKANKMQVSYEMCLMDYDFSILDDAFLVHSPGVKVFNREKERFRFKFQYKNNAVMKDIKQALWKKYGGRRKC